MKIEHTERENCQLKQRINSSIENDFKKNLKRFRVAVNNLEEEIPKFKKVCSSEGKLEKITETLNDEIGSLKRRFEETMNRDKNEHQKRQKTINSSNMIFLAPSKNDFCFIEVDGDRTYTQEVQISDLYIIDQPVGIYRSRGTANNSFVYRGPQNALYYINSYNNRQYVGQRFDSVEFF